MARALYLDVEQGRFVSGLDNGLQPSLDLFFQGDNAPYELYFLQKSTAVPAAFLYEPLNFSARSVKFAIGAPPPSTAIYATQNTWTNTSGVVTASVATTVTGSASANEQQTLTFAPPAYDGTFSLSVPARAITVSSVSGGIFTTSGSHSLALFEPFTVTGFTTPTGFSNGNTLFAAALLSPTQLLAAPTPTTSGVTGYTANGGTMRTITATTSLLGARSTGAQVQSALEQLPSVGAGNIAVIAVPGTSYRLVYQGAKQQASLPVATVAAALTPVFSKTANIDLSTVTLGAALSGAASVSAVLEIETTNGSNVETLCQVPITLLNDIIT